MAHPVKAPSYCVDEPLCQCPGLKHGLGAIQSAGLRVSRHTPVTPAVQSGARSIKPHLKFLPPTHVFASWKETAADITCFRGVLAYAVLNWQWRSQRPWNTAGHSKFREMGSWLFDLNYYQDGEVTECNELPAQRNKLVSEFFFWVFPLLHHWLVH